jgi:alkanesulfonate monooxygenase SsuD/methylene tetrahydromethanopterin reductase-like flavin-dependent oxidoreductase (luciferase family)
MAVGITLYSNRPEEMVPISRHAEALGYEGVWLGDHVVAPEVMGEEHPYATRVPMVLSGDERMYDLWVTLGAIIGATSTIKVAAGIYLLPLRHPILTARACLSAHKMSGGRFRFGVGVGWLASEFEALGVPFKDRGRQTDEILDILAKLFAGNGPLAYDGPTYKFPSLQLTREPANIPLLFGGTKGPAIRRAALRGDGWYGTTIPLEDCIAIKREIERLRRENGLEKKPYEFIGRPVGPATNENLDRYRAAGFHNLVIPWETVHPSDGADMSLGGKLQSLEKTAKALGLKAP